MADRLQQKRILTDRLKEVVSRYSNLLPEEQAIAGIKDISRKLGEFITTPAASTAWDYDALLKLDGPALFRKISGAWGSGQRTNKGQLLIQPGSKQDVVNPFTGKVSKKDPNPGTRVHHKVQIASIWRSIENLDTDTQIALIEALNDRAYQLGNDPKNIVALLDYTHEYAGDTAAHVWGDTKGAHFRTPLTPEMSFNEQLDALIENSIKPQYKDIFRATAPGTVEYAYRQKQAKDFENITGKSIENSTPVDRKKFGEWLKERSDLSVTKRDLYDKSLVDPANQRTRDIYETHYQNVASGQRSSGLGPLKGAARKELDKLLISGRESSPDVKPYLATLNEGQPLPDSRSKEYKALVSKARATLAAKTGYPQEMGMYLMPDPRDALKAVRENPRGAMAGVAVSALNPEVAQAVEQNNLGAAGRILAKDVALGTVSEMGIKAALPLAGKYAPALAKIGGVAGAAGTGAALFSQGQSGSLTDVLTRKAAQNPVSFMPAVQANPETDIGARASRAIANEVKYLSKQAKPLIKAIDNELRWLGKAGQRAFNNIFGKREI